jgi:hypothetical protein
MVRFTRQVWLLPLVVLGALGAASGCESCGDGTVADAAGHDAAVVDSGAIDAAIADHMVADQGRRDSAISDHTAVDHTAVDHATATDRAAAIDSASATDAAVAYDATHRDAAAGCGTPVPFGPQGQIAAWRHSIETPLVTAMGAANHRGQDVIVNPGQTQRLIAKFAYGATDVDLTDEDVEIFIQTSPPCGSWESFGVVATSNNGQYGTVDGIADDGGRVFFTIPTDRALPLGRYPVRMLVLGDHSLAAFTLWVVSPGTSAVVLDIDGTLTTGDSELVYQLVDEIFSGSYVPEMRPAADQVVLGWDDRNYLIIYLTGRPDMLSSRSREWLVERGLPAGVLHHTDTNPQALPSGVAQYKSDFLTLHGASQLVLYAAYGNASTDITAYAAAGIPLARTFVIGDHAVEGGTVALTDYAAHLGTLQTMPHAATSAPRPSDWW